MLHIDCRWRPTLKLFSYVVETVLVFETVQVKFCVSGHYLVSERGRKNLVCVWILYNMWMLIPELHNQPAIQHSSSPLKPSSHLHSILSKDKYSEVLIVEVEGLFWFSMFLWGGQIQTATFVPEPASNKTWRGTLPLLRDNTLFVFYSFCLCMSGFQRSSYMSFFTWLNS